MKSLTEHMTAYARYHRDPRNIATHFVGIPLIVVSLSTLLSRPQWELGGYAVSAAWLVALLSTAFYLRLNAAVGALMGLLLVGSTLLGAQLAAGSVASWLAWGLGLFVFGWFTQFVGHYYEGRKPAFVDDLVGLLQGPLFVVMEVCMAVGLFAAMRQTIEDQAGPVRRNPNGQPQA